MFCSGATLSREGLANNPPAWGDRDLKDLGQKTKKATLSDRGPSLAIDSDSAYRSKVNGVR